ncbi:MAG: putative hemolysin [Candidatus Azotimanducaceae bacterium]|jgi:putative hemolysin
MIESASAAIEISTSIAPIRAGRFEARFALTSDEVRQAQELRYDVMYEEKGGRPDLKKIKAKADIDEWDDRAVHIVVIDHDQGCVVGTLRLVCSNHLAEDQSFYTETAFDLSGLRNHYPMLLELGRFCIQPTRRTGVILMLIWKYAMNFIVANPIDVMLGCASFPGTDANAHVDVLSWLYHHNRAPEALMPRPIIDHIRLDEIVDKDTPFAAATRDVPPLLRGYLKLGAKAGDCAILDPVFNTTFIAIYVDAKSMLTEDTVLIPSKRS